MPESRDAFCLYLWRTKEAPGTLYLARDVEHATAVYKELVDEGYTVKVVHVPTDTEYQMRGGLLTPAYRKRPLISLDKSNSRTASL